MALPQVKLDQGIHAMHLFYSFDRQLWESLPEGASAEAQAKLQALCEANANASHPCIRTYANVGGKADLAFFILGEELGTVAQLHRDIEACFPGGALVPVYNYLSVTELSEYMPTEEDSKRRVMGEFRLEPGTPEFDAKMEELAGMRNDYERYRLYPEMPDWEVMCFYPML
ncbi:MAG: chlorite dismutase family protein, partial [Verrucomicrobiota bacterium]|nr:chlorite dismutase family protein [Verrucomicrobiota bacterium]